jgi:methylenetetrahydrofolate reductase (NADPH)
LFDDLGTDVDISFEFFPPKTPEAGVTLRESMQALAGLRPQFFSMTYGAGGSTRDKTHEAVAWVARELPVPAAAHLTCVDASRDEVDAVAHGFWEAGVRHIVALRGDPPAGGRFEPRPDGYRSAAELVEGLSRVAPFEISVACYPEVHPDASCADTDLDNLKRKLDAGATRALSQFFFAPETFLRFRDRAAAAGITHELVPGILPVTNVTQTRRMAGQCGTAIPDWMERLMSGLDGRPGVRQLVAASVAAELCRRLYDEGVRNFHFYTLNRADLPLAVCHLFGLRPRDGEQPLAAAA